jgi:hypothetical protein
MVLDNKTGAINIKKLLVSTLFRWCSKIQCRKGSYYIALDKKIVKGLRLERGDTVTSYLSKDESSNPVILVELKERKLF